MSLLSNVLDWSLLICHILSFFANTYFPGACFLKLNAHIHDKFYKEINENAGEIKAETYLPENDSQEEKHSSQLPRLSASMAQCKNPRLNPGDS